MLIKYLIDQQIDLNSIILSCSYFKNLTDLSVVSCQKNIIFFLKTWNLKEKIYTTKNIIILINKEDYYNENRNNQKRDNQKKY